MGSKDGTLTFMVGSPRTLFPRLKSLLVHMGKPESIFHCGDVGSGTAFKLINNYISIISVLSVSEAYNIANRLDLDLNKLTEILNTGSAQCWVTSKNNPVPGIHPEAPASHGYEGGFRLELAHKVLELGKDLAESAGARTVLDKAALKVFQDAADDPRYAGKDARVVYKFLTENGL
jgi:3-hydroxyisobutyrate dehydrogenase